MNRQRSANDRGGEREAHLPLPPLSGIGRVWGLNVLLVVGAGAAYAVLTRSGHGLAPPRPIPWWALAAAFALAETFVVHFQSRREAHSFSLSEIPLVLGLFFVTPRELLLAQLVGAAAALTLHRRQSPVKLVFNLGHFSLEAGVAAIVFHRLVGGNPIGPWGWGASFAATLVTTLLGALAIASAISLAEGRSRLRTLPRGLGFGTIVALTNTCLALIGVTILWRAPEALWLVIVPSAILFAAYRSYTFHRQKHETLELLYEITRGLQRSLRVDSTMLALLQQARRMFRAERAEVTLFPEGDDQHGLRTALGPGDELEVMRPVELDPRTGVWARVASEGQALLFARPIQNPNLRQHFALRGLKDAMVAPLRGERGIVGKLLVGNRMGDVSTFDREDLKLFETLANHASVSLENARLVARLEESLAHLTEMNRLKDDFVATVSHELRTPLTSIQGSIKTLLRLELDPGEQRLLLQAADRGGDRLHHMIEDLLMASRIESRKVQAVVKSTSIAELAAQVAAELGPSHPSHELELRFPDELRVETDHGKVVQILSNLVENAVKYSPAGSRVTVSGRGDDAGIVVSVENPGPGIPSEHTERVFDRFYQVDQSSTRTVGGAGLGLYICRRLAEAIGGRVWLERSDPTATVFALFVPATPPEDAVRADDEYVALPPLLETA